MIDLIVFSVANNRYAINIENVQRIIQAETLTMIPNAHSYIDGMMSYEENVIKVLNFRKIILLETYENTLSKLFISLKNAHVEWVNRLKISLETGAIFTKTLDPHACELGKWIDSFTAYDDHVIKIVNELSDYHKQLHLSGSVALNLYDKNKEKAPLMLHTDIEAIYSKTMGALDKFINELDLVANSLQKLIIYDKDGVVFAIKVDSIEDIAHVQEGEFIAVDNEDDINNLLELDGILDLDNVLINVIKTVKLPK